MPGVPCKYPSNLSRRALDLLLPALPEALSLNEIMIGSVIALFILFLVAAFCWLAVFSKSTRQVFTSDQWWQWKLYGNREEDKRIRDRATFATMLIAALATTALFAYVLFLVINL